MVSPLAGLVNLQEGMLACATMVPLQKKTASEQGSQADERRDAHDGRIAGPTDDLLAVGERKVRSVAEVAAQA